MPRAFKKPVFVASLVALFALALGVSAGSLTPPGTVASTMHSLSELYASIASSSFDSSSLTANRNGSLIQNLKYIEQNITWASSSGNIWNLNSGNVGIGTVTPAAKLHVSNGTLLVNGQGNPKLVATIPTSATIVGPQQIAVSGKYLYTLGQSSQGLQISDISNPASPSVISETVLGGGTNIGRIIVSGKYLYAANQDRIQIIDISNPAAPFVVSTTNPGLSWIYNLYLSGKYLYIAASSGTGNGLIIYDVSNPKNPFAVRSAGFSNNNGAVGLYVSGKYAYVGQAGNFKDMRIYDISNPAATQLVGTYTNTAGAHNIYVSGKYAYIAAGTSGLEIVKISNPSNPVLVGTIDTPGKTTDVIVDGRYAYIGDGNSFDTPTFGGVRVIDVFNPAAPVEVGSYVVPAGAYMEGIAISGKYLYAVSQSVGAGTYIFDIGGADIYAANIGALQASNILVQEDVDIANTLHIGNGLTVGTNGILSSGPMDIAASTSDNLASASYEPMLRIMQNAGLWRGNLMAISAAVGTTADKFTGNFALFISAGSNRIILGSGGEILASGAAQFGSAGSPASVSYSRFGTSTTTHSNWISSADDLFLSSDLEGRGSLSFAGPASLSNTLWVSPGSFSGNVGIGTANVDAKFEVNGTASISNGFFVDASGNVGIGTTGPQTSVDIEGSANGDLGLYAVNTSTGGSASAITLVGKALSGANYGYLAFHGSGFSDSGAVPHNSTHLFGGGDRGLVIEEWQASSSMRFFTGGSSGVAREQLTLDANAFGRVGVHETTPDAVFAVGTGADGAMLASGSGNVDFTLNSTTSDDTKFTIRSAGAFDRLDILGSVSQNYLTILKNGSVGIASNSPGQVLSVEGNVRIDGRIALGNAGQINRVDVFNGASGTQYSTLNLYQNETAIDRGNVNGLNSVLNYNPTAPYAGAIQGALIQIQTGTFPVSGGVSGLETSVVIGGGGAPMPDAAGYTSYIEVNRNGSSVTQARGIVVLSPEVNYGIIASAYGIWVDDQRAGADPASISQAYGIYVNGSLTPSYFEGNVGIGTARVDAKLEVTGTASLSLAFVDLTGAQTTHAVCHPSSGTGVHEQLVDCDPTAGADFMEMYPMSPDVQEGEIVVPGIDTVTTSDGTHVPILLRSVTPYASSLIGISSVASAAGDFNSIGHNLPSSSNPKPLALSGRVLLKVSTKNGPIQVGDKVTSSDLPGIGMKATQAGMTVGTALESFDSVVSGSQQKILIFVNPQYWAPDVGAVGVAPTTAPAQDQDSWDWTKIMSRMKFWLSSLYDITIDNGLLQTVRGIFHTVDVQDGVIIHDRATGMPFCVTIEDGQMITAQGDCNMHTPPSIPSEAPLPSVSPADAPTVSPTFEPSISVAPTPAETPAPAATETPAI